MTRKHSTGLKIECIKTRRHPKHCGNYKREATQVEFDAFVKAQSKGNNEPCPKCGEPLAACDYMLLADVFSI